MRVGRVLAPLAALLMAAQATLAGPAPLNWSDLRDPAVQQFEDPYRDLSPEQFDDLLFAVRLRGRLQQDRGTAEERRKWQALLDETEDALAADGIDVDWLLDQREAVTERRRRAATQGNPAYDGQIVTLVGFAIPAPPEADGRAVAYLVPERGMCSHMPPPPPNQMIRVRLSNDWAPTLNHEPVRLTGRLVIDPSEQQMVVVDGLMPMRATFRLDVTGAEPLAQTAPSTADAAERMRAGARRKTGGASD
ncbi:hypothetical protein SAMN05444279_101287 [Ruegeria intermedia]|uniref:DUF3299 domain-containing protein n=1 Tax=Ruegeria intermedia TaxID=996115 RepID=A0A1M4SUH3_9RHOB|nr:DUF3299 domain-containing protein [Ruegeria intermedia]SHE35845.1 hypothetical protein SAMN05444279_101287 [Ruegeria intermedia]